jgi:hypothetical protein
MIPSGTSNTFRQGQFEWGFRYEYTANGTRVKVWGHSANPNAPAGSYSASNPTATMQVNNRFVTSTGETVRNSTSEQNAPLIHIPLLFE